MNSEACFLGGGGTPAGQEEGQDGCPAGQGWPYCQLLLSGGGQGWPHCQLLLSYGDQGWPHCQLLLSYGGQGWPYCQLLLSYGGQGAGHHICLPNRSLGFHPAL